MAGKKFENGSPEFKWFGEFWKLSQKIWEPSGQNDNEYWDNVVSDINALTKEHAASDETLKKFSIRMSVALMEFLEIRGTGRDYYLQNETDLRNVMDLWKLAKTDENARKILSGVAALARK